MFLLMFPPNMHTSWRSIVLDRQVCFSREQGTIYFDHIRPKELAQQFIPNQLVLE